MCLYFIIKLFNKIRVITSQAPELLGPWGIGPLDSCPLCLLLLDSLLIMIINTKGRQLNDCVHLLLSLSLWPWFCINKDLFYSFTSGSKVPSTSSSISLHRFTHSLVPCSTTGSITWLMVSHSLTWSRTVSQWTPSGRSPLPLRVQRSTGQSGTRLAGGGACCSPLSGWWRTRSERRTIDAGRTPSSCGHWDDLVTDGQTDVSVAELRVNQVSEVVVLTSSGICERNETQRREAVTWSHPPWPAIQHPTQHILYPNTHTPEPIPCPDTLSPTETATEIVETS